MKIVASILAFALVASAGVTIRKTGKAPTGYEVDFHYVNKTAQRVTIGGGIWPLTDSLHTGLGYGAGYDPHEYKPGDFYVTFLGKNTTWPYEMKSDRHGIWTYTTPLPSGIYSYAYLVDCDDPQACSVDTGKLVIDPENRPFENAVGDQVASSFQVPFDPRFQFNPNINTNFDYALDLPDESGRGTVKSVNYTSPGSIHPEPDVHDFSIYLPAGYGSGEKHKYPLMYLSHGAGGNGNDWENLARMSRIMDHLIAEGHIEPTVVVTPSFYNLDSTLPRFIYGNNSNNAPAPSAQHVRENYQKYLFPWVEEHFDVCDEPSCRAFAGLSLGGRLTYEMYVNATDFFDWFGFFSPATSAPYVDSDAVAARPQLAQKGLFVGYGLYDFVFQSARDLEAALSGSDIGFVSRISPFGGHYWNTWQDHLWWFGRTALWKPIPFTSQTGRDQGAL